MMVMANGHGFPNSLERDGIRPEPSFFRDLLGTIPTRVLFSKKCPRGGQKMSVAFTQVQITYSVTLSPGA
jgi:hypothetical protein